MPKTILVVDDEDGVRDSVREVLNDEGYRVVDTADGTQVLDIIKSERPDLVLLDIWMPQIDGIGLLKEIKIQEPDINVVMVSGHGNIHTAVTATKFGAFDFIEKPVSLDGLLLTVQRALGELPRATGPEQNGGRSRKARSARATAAAPLSAAGAQTIKQRTLKKSVVLSGQGLHSGVKTGLILHPLPANSGILFTGISGDVTVPAHLDYVGSTGYATSLRSKGFAVGTVEHFLAVLHSYGVTNLLAKVQSEVPIMDGSAEEFCQALEEAGIEEQAGECLEIVIDRPYEVRRERRRVNSHRARRYIFRALCFALSRTGGRAGTPLHLSRSGDVQGGDRAGADFWFLARHRKAPDHGTGRRRQAQQLHHHRRR